MSFLLPLNLILIALAIPILLLWFLRQKREPIEVPTVFFWQKAAQEERVSPLLRNLTKSILLLLQLIVLALLVASLAGAVLNLRLAGGARRVIILLDRSASMGIEESGGKTRLATVKERIGVLLGTLQRGDQAMLIAFDAEAKVLSGFTDDGAALKRLLARVRPLDLGTNAGEAVLLAEAAAASLSSPSVEVFLFSDGAFPALTETPPGLEDVQFSFVGVGEVEANSGIIGVDLDSGMESNARLFVRVANAGDAPVERTLVLSRDGVALDATTATIPPGEVAGSAFDLSSYGTGAFELKLEPGDAFTVDDRAFLVLSDPPVRRILVVTDGNPSLDRLKDFHPGVEVYMVPPADVTAEVGAGIGAFDLTVFDGVVPDAAVPGSGDLGPSAVYFDCVPPGTELVLADLITDPPLVDWARGHPLNRNVDWRDVRVARASPISGARTATTILETTRGPLVQALPGTGTRVVFGFRLEDSNLPLRVGFPIFFANLLDLAFRETAAGTAGYIPCGAELMRPIPRGAAGAVVRAPDGAETPLPALPDSTVSFSATDHAGFYALTVSGDGMPEERIAVTFLDPDESIVAPRGAVEIGGKERASSPEAVEANYPLRTPLLLIALACLLLEWVLWLRGSARRPLTAATPAS